MATATLLVLATTACAGASANTLGIPEQVDGISDTLLRAYGQAAAATPELAPDCTGMRWSILAGIGQMESLHGTLNGSSIGPAGIASPPIIGPPLNGDGFASIPDTDQGFYDRDTAWDRAVGPMQFIPGTWEAYKIDGNGDGAFDPQNAFDATFTAASYICGTGHTDLSDPATLETRLMAYNQSQAYVDEVMANIAAYDALPVASAAGSFGAGATGAAATAIAWATQHVGSPYVWGGSCLNPQQTLQGARRAPTPADQRNNCDCSSLVQQAYDKAGVTLTRTTWTQFNQTDLQRIEPANGRGSALSEQDLAQLLPGDLLYFFSEGAPGGAPSHVGMYLGGRKMVHAPNSDRDIEIIDMQADRGGYYMGGGALYYGARRVAN
ncbi:MULTISPECIES: C40 family peptidase [Nocardiopsis]|uniref:C40 family peptidase n=1 Tax=Nocardiopsis TaxID=2013 RepID=UPI0011802152|nr:MULTISPECIES: NlpC/P60 family protein [Nocardiopsis]